MSNPPQSRPFLLGLLLCSLLAGWPIAGKAEECLNAGCHPKLDALGNRHAPAAEGECEACHRRLPGNHPEKGAAAFELTAKGADLCTQCHDSPGEGKIVHAPAAEGDCLTCHNPHGAPGRFLLRMGEDTARLCRECHDDNSFDQPFLHGPVAAGDCTACHDPHRSGEKGLLKKPVRNLCLGCHTAFAGLEKAPVSHPPVREEACTICHQPHGSSTRNLLATGQPGICLTCHPKVGVKMEKAETRHAPLYLPESCGGCHSTHYSEHPGLLPSDQKALCLSCHGKDNNAKAGGMRNIARELQQKKFLHGPVREGECAACHDPHGSDSFRLLSGPYPADFYVPYRPGIYDFCLQCHDKDLLRFAETSIYTQFRNGKQNLHYVHSADGRKSRTCRTCHEPHAGDNPKLIRTEGAPFGDWKIPIRFQATATGGSCAPGCHRELTYDREQPVTYEK